MKKKIMVTLDEDLLLRLDRQMELESRNRSSLISFAILKYLDSEDAEKFRREWVAKYGAAGEVG